MAMAAKTNGMMFFMLFTPNLKQKSNKTNAWNAGTPPYSLMYLLTITLNFLKSFEE